jgi:hypothetical protein
MQKVKEISINCIFIFTLSLYTLTYRIRVKLKNSLNLQIQIFKSVQKTTDCYLDNIFGYLKF